MRPGVEGRRMDPGGLGGWNAIAADVFFRGSLTLAQVHCCVTFMVGQIEPVCLREAGCVQRPPLVFASSSRNL